MDGWFVVELSGWLAVAWTEDVLAVNVKQWSYASINAKTKL